MSNILISKSTSIGVCEVREKIRTAFLDVVLRDEDLRRDSVASKETVDPTESGW